VIDDTSKRKRLLIFVEKNAPPVPEGFQPLYPWYGEKLPLHFVPIPKEANSESKEFRQAIVGRRVGQEFMVATPGSGSTLLTYEVLDVA
jgi:hypothetical protein